MENVVQENHHVVTLQTHQIHPEGTICLLTLVVPGGSDQVIKIFPAEHKSEKIFLDNTPGIERWEMIKRMINNFSDRNRPAAKPRPYHSDPKNLRERDLRDEDIETAVLQGALLKAPPTERRLVSNQPVQVQNKETEQRFTAIETRVDNLVEAIQGLTKAMALGEKPGKVKKSMAKVACKDCGKEVDPRGMRFHVKRHGK